MLPFLNIQHIPPRQPSDSVAQAVVSYHTLKFDSIEEFEAFMGASMHPLAMGGLVDVFIGCYDEAVADCFVHVFAFVVVHNPLGTSAIIACDRGQPCQTYSGSHIERELREQLEDRQLTWPQFVALHAKHRPGVSMRDKARAWADSKLFQASVTVLLDVKVPRFKLSTLESIYHRLATVCFANDTLRSTIGRLFTTITFDQQQYPICWMVSVVWLLALLPRLTERGEADLGGFVASVVNAKTVDNWIAQIETSMTTRNVYRTWRMPRAVVDAYTKRANAPFDLTKTSEGGFAFEFLEAALRAIGITLLQSVDCRDTAQP